MSENEHWQTGLHASNCEDWPVLSDTKRDADGYPDSDRPRETASLRRIGWLDQKGRVWLTVPPQAGFDGGSLMPLLIDPGER